MNTLHAVYYPSITEYSIQSNQCEIGWEVLILLNILVRFLNSH